MGERKRKKTKAVAEVCCLALFITFIVNEGREKLSLLSFTILFVSLILTETNTIFNDWQYYFLNAFFCFLAAEIHLGYERRTELHVDLAIIWYGCLAIHGAGYLLYELGYNPIFYSGAFGLFSIALITRLFIRKDKDGLGRDVTVSSRLFAFCLTVIRFFSGHKEGNV